MSGPNIVIMSTKEEWIGFYKSLRDVLRNGDSKFSGMEAFNEINTLLILVFIEEILHNFIKNEDDVKMCSFSNIYDLFYTNVEKKIKDDKIIEPELRRFRNKSKDEMYSYLFEKIRRYNPSLDKETGSQIYTPKKEIIGDIYLKHKDPVFLHILQNNKLGRLFIRIKTDLNSQSLKDMSVITTFHKGHANDVYEVVRKIAETFYLKDSNNEFIRGENGKLQSILRHSDLNYDALGSAYEDFMKDDTLNSKNTGEFFTRRDLIDFTFKGSCLTEDDIIYDSTVGTGGFLLSSISFIKKKLENDLIEGKISKEQHDSKLNNFLKNNVHGNEIKPNLYKSLILNILMHDPTGLCLDNLKCVDSMLINKTEDDTGNKERSLNFCTYATGNPPYGGSLKGTPDNIFIQNTEFCDKEDTDSENYFKPMMTGKSLIGNSSGQFIMHFLRSLKDGGHARFIIDRGILINGNDGKKSWQKLLRKYMVEKNNLYKIVLLPTGIFEHTNFATCLIYIQKGVKTVSTEFQELYFKSEDKGIGFKPFFVGNSWNVLFNDIKTKEYSLNPKDFNIPLKEFEKNKVDEIIEIKNDLLISIEWKNLSEVFDFLPKSKRKASEGNKTGKYPFFTSSFIVKYCDTCDINELCLILGDGGSANIKISNNFSCSNHNYVLKNKIKNDILTKFIFYYFLLNINELNKGFGGNGLKNISKEYIQSLKIPIPSFENQQKIVDKLDYFFSETSEFKLDLNTIMKYESANNLLNLIFNEEWAIFLNCVLQAQQKNDLQYVNDKDYLKILSNKINVKYNPDTKSKTKRSDNDFIMDNFLKKEFDIISEGISFETKKIGEICTIKGGIKFKLNGTSNHGNIPYFRVQNFKNIKNLFYINKIDEIKVERFKIKTNDLLLSIVGSIGLTLIVPKEYNEFAISGNIIRLFDFKNINVYYFKYIFELNKQTYLEKSGKNCQPNLSITKVKDFCIPIPSLVDQTKIVEYLDKQIEFYQTFFNKIKLFYPNNDDDIDNIDDIDDIVEI